jgi:hypothetical protein
MDIEPAAFPEGIDPAIVRETTIVASVATGAAVVDTPGVITRVVPERVLLGLVVGSCTVDVTLTVEVRETDTEGEGTVGGLDKREEVMMVIDVGPSRVDLPVCVLVSVLVVTFPEIQEGKTSKRDIELLKSKLTVQAYLK